MNTDKLRTARDAVVNGLALTSATLVGGGVLMIVTGTGFRDLPGIVTGLYASLYVGVWVLSAWYLVLSARIRKAGKK